MSVLIPATINGANYLAQGEYTAQPVAQDYQNSVAAFANIFNLGLDANISGVDPSDPNVANQVISKIDSSNYETELLHALLGGTVTLNKGIPGQETQVQVTGLLNLAKSGLFVAQDADPVVNQGQWYMTVEMTSAVDELVRTLRMAGVQFGTNPDGSVSLTGSITKDMVKNWRDLAASSTAIQRIISNASQAAGDANRTLQALVELIYVRTGNELLSDSLDNLESALEATKASLSALNSLEILHNKITAQQKSAFQTVYASTYALTNPSQFVRGQKDIPGVVSAADIYFKSVDPQILSTLTAADTANFLSLRNTLIEQIRALSGQTGGTASTQGGTLVANLRTVLQNIQAAFVAAGGSTGSAVGVALTKWILDNYQVDVNPATQSADQPNKISGLSPGEIQRNISAAIAAGQSLNDTQKEQVQRYLFVFEEYYKSAAAILTKITQILERMAQAIAR